VLLVVLLSATVACEAGPAAATPQPSAGSSDRPREVNLVMRDYSFAPDPVDLIPGETVRLQVVNAGLDWHEAVVGDQAVQDAWEVAEGATVGAPPGPTPVVSVAPELAGLRIVVPSGGRVDAIWTVPSDPAEVGRLLIGCHIPGHYAKGMRAGIRIPGVGAPGQG
jgi:plastocyanin